VIGKLEFDVVIRDPSSEETSTSLSQATQLDVSKPAVQAEPLAQEYAASETMVDMPTASYAAVGGGDTPFPPNAMGQPGMGQPGMGMYGQPPLGYPQYPPQMQYGYPGYQMPGYYQQPMGYPQVGMYPGMPQQMMPPQGMPATATISEPIAESQPETRLPDPETTGAKAPEPKPVEAAGDGSKPVSMRDTAADIINKYRTRPPAG
jgi:hypothetical protein